MKSKRGKYIWLFLLSLAALTLFNQWLPITDPVESNYALTAKEMLAAGDWLSPRIYGEYWYDKPIFTYWTLVLSYFVCGVTDFAARLPSALMGAGTVVLTATTARYMFKREAAFWYAGGFLLTSFAFWPISRAVITDAALLFWTAVTMYGAYRGLLEDRRRWMVVAYAGAGFACLTKGPVGLVLPGLILLVWLAVTPEARRWKRLFDPVGIAAFILTAAPWYTMMYLRHGEDFVLGFLGLHNYVRATVAEHPEDNVFYYYLVVMPVYALPWTALTLREIWAGRKRANTAYRFCLAWIGITFVFYTLMATKYMTYAYIAIIPMVLLATRSWLYITDAKERRQYWWLTAPVVLMILIWAGATFAAPWGKWTLFYIMVAVSLYVLFHSQFRGTGAGLAARAILILTLVSLTVILEGLAPFMATRSTRAVAETMAELPGPQYIYYNYATSYPYYTGRIPELLDHETEINEGWENKYTMPMADADEFMAQLENGEWVVLYVPKRGRRAFGFTEYMPYMVRLQSFPSGDIYVSGGLKKGEI